MACESNGEVLCASAGAADEREFHQPRAVLDRRALSTPDRRNPEISCVHEIKGERLAGQVVFIDYFAFGTIILIMAKDTINVNNLISNKLHVVARQRLHDHFRA
jgi:hypothetical protein